MPVPVSAEHFQACAEADWAYCKPEPVRDDREPQGQDDAQDEDPEPDEALAPDDEDRDEARAHGDAAAAPVCAAEVAAHDGGDAAAEAAVCAAAEAAAHDDSDDNIRAAAEAAREKTCQDKRLRQQSRMPMRKQPLRQKAYI